MRYSDQLTFNGLTIPINIYIERRNGTRVSFTASGLNLRISNRLRQNEIDSQIDWGKNWARNRIIKKPSIAYRYVDRDYRDGSIITLFDQKLIVSTKESKHNRAYIEAGKIIIESQPSAQVSSNQIKKIIIKILNKSYHTKIESRLIYINNLTVKKNIKRLTLKYLKSQWGNCATDGHIKLSTRILLLPERIQNAIIMHELVHLVHFDHSSSFYKTLESFMPDYKNRDRWLKEYEGMVDF